MSRNCDLGRHVHCLGTVLTYPRDPGAREALTDCECPTAECGHGTDYEKARQRR